MKEFVSVSDFVYKGYEIYNVGDGDSFCYCPCDIYGTPKLYYADCHFSCAANALQDILNSFHGGDANDVFNDDEWNNIVQDIWLNCISEPGRVFFEKYIVVGFDGHMPNREYVDGVISYLGGSYNDYVILYNEGGRVHELSYSSDINGTNNKPNKLDVPDEIKRLYDMKMSKMNSINGRFPTNITKAEYYSLIRQENTDTNMNKKLIRLTESDLHRIIKESVNKILNEGFGDGMIERALNKKLKKLEANLTIGNLFDGLYHCQPTKCYATFESEDPNECGFVFKFYGGQYGYITLGGVYGFSSDHLSAAEYNAFLKGAEKLIPIIKKTIDEC